MIFKIAKSPKIALNSQKAGNRSSSGYPLSDRRTLLFNGALTAKTAGAANPEAAAVRLNESTERGQTGQFTRAQTRLCERRFSYGINTRPWCKMDRGSPGNHTRCQARNRNVGRVARGAGR